MYHFIFDSEEKISGMIEGDKVYGVSTVEFAWQMSCLKKKGYYVLLLSEYLQKSREHSLPEKSIVITFDDGHLSTYTLAYPILKNAGFTVEIFVATDFIKKDDYMSWDQLLELDKEGYSIQSHTSSHPFLTDISDNEIWEELDTSKKKIENHLKKPCRFFCPPGGRYNEKVKRIAKSIGYEAVCTSSVGYNDPNSDVMELCRFPILLSTTREDFKKILDRDLVYLIMLYTKHRLLKILKTVMGNTLYNIFREKAIILRK